MLRLILRKNGVLGKTGSKLLVNGPLVNAVFLAFHTQSSLSLWSAFRAAGSDYSPSRSEAKLFRIEFSDLHVSKEDSVKPWCDQLESQLLEAENFADENPVLVPAVLFTRRGRRPLGYVNSGMDRGRRMELGW
jgi:hypothetical protein